MWWNSSQNTTLDDGGDDGEYAAQMEAIRREEDYRQQRQAQYERLVAEGYYDSVPGALDIRRN